MDEVKPFDIPKREVWEAFKKVKANQGAAWSTDSRLRTLRLIFQTTSTSSGTGCRQGATFLRRCDAWIFRRWMAVRARWAFQRLLTVSPRKLPVAT